MGSSLFQATALHLSFLSLANSTLLVEQLRALMQAVLWSSTLDSLDLTGCDFDGVEGQLLADAAAALSSLSLTAAKLDVKQISSLLHVRCFLKKIGQRQLGCLGSLPPIFSP